MNQNKGSLHEQQKLQKVAVVVIEIIEHNPGMAPVKTVIRKTNEFVTSSRFASDDVFNEHTANEEILFHLATGHVRILIDGNIHELNAGDSLKVAANASRQISEGARFTLISTDIKTGSV